jgi:hypothetical protein
VSGIARHIASRWIVVVAVVAGSGCSEQSPRAGEGKPDRPQSVASEAGSASSTPSQVSGGYEGYLERMSCDLLRGWAWDRSQPDRALMVDLYDGDRLLKTTVADQFRQDLLDARKGNGRHMFVEVPPPEIKDGKPHSIRAVAKGTSFTRAPFPNPPSSITCAR